VPFDIAAAESYGLLANLARAAGRDPRPWRPDLLIAATVERHGLSLATRNAADFRYLSGCSTSSRCPDIPRLTS
jgi:predicted nucleic acid-binding protein